MQARQFYPLMTMFKNYIFALLLTCSATVSFSTNYYFSTSGSDGFSIAQAQSVSTPWKTIQKLYSFIPQLHAGDSVLFKRGDVFYGSFEIDISGSLNNPIVFGAYGNGPKPVISGFSKLEGWTSLGGGVWECNAPEVLNDANIFVIDNKDYAVGRYPNANAINGGYLTIQSHQGQSSITSINLSSSPNWTGGELVIRKDRWILDKAPITSHNGTTISYTNSTDYTPGDGYGFFVQRHPATLDQYGEWYFNSSPKKMMAFFGSENPNNHQILATATKTIITLNHQHNIVFDGLELQGSNSESLRLFSASNITVRNCDFNFAGKDGLFANSINNVSISNSIVSSSHNNGIDFNFDCNSVTLSNNRVRKSGAFAGMGQNSDGGYTGVYLSGINNTVSNNQVDSSGYIGIGFFGDNLSITNNFVTYTTFIKDDGGGICTGGHDGSFAGGVKRVFNNIVLYAQGAGAGTANPEYLPAHGFYIDDKSTNVEITGNTAAYCGESGFYVHNSNQISLMDNTSFANQKQIFLKHDITAPSNPLRNISSANNVLFSKLPDQVVADYRSKDNDIENWGSMDQNFYVRPFNDFETVSVDVSTSLSYPAYYNLLDWRSLHGMDQNSKGSPVIIPLRSVSNVSGTNRYTNGRFNQAISGVFCSSGSESCNNSWTTVGGLDGGCLRVPVINSNSTKTISLNIPIGSIVAGRNYVVRFSSIATANNRNIKVFLRKKDSPYTVLSSETVADMFTYRKENEIVLSAMVDEPDANIVFEVQENSNFTYFLDNIELMEATITSNQPADFIRFEYNAGNTTKSIALDGIYIDARGQFRSGVVTLNPFSSIVLIKSISVTLPVKFIDFTGRTTDDGNKLNWIVEQEKNVDRYEVERSVNGADFFSIGKAPAINISSGTYTYQFTDQQPAKGYNYYRIREVALNGKSSFSKSIRLNNQGNISVSFTPNPVKDNLIITLNEKQRQSKGMLELINTGGQVVKQMACSFTDNISMISLGNVPAGIYVVRLNLQDQIYRTRIVKD